MNASRVVRPRALRLNLLAAGVVAACGLAAGSFGFDAAQAASIQAGANRNVRSVPQARLPIDRASRANFRKGQGRVVAAPPDRPAATITVANCDDAGPGSLRQALIDAVDGDVVDLTSLACSTITLTSGALIANEDVTIDGPGMDALTITAGSASAVLWHYGSYLVINGVTLADGLYPSGIGSCAWVYGSLTMNASRVTGCVAGDGSNSAAYGAGLDVLGDLTLIDSIVSGNTAQAGAGAYGYGAYGGGIYCYGYVTLDNSIVSGNSAIASGYAQAIGGGIRAGYGVYAYGGSVVSANTASAQDHFALGGGIFSASIATTVSSSVLDNEVRSESYRAYGGGIHAVGNVGVHASTISGNTAHSDDQWAYGGGIHAGYEWGSLGGSNVALVGSTISGNTVSANCSSCNIRGGGVHAFGTIEAESSTISGNRSVLPEDSAGSAGGGGLASADWYGYDFTATLASSTVSGNAASSGSGGFAYGAGVSPVYASFVSYNSTVAFNSAIAGNASAGGVVLSSESGVVNMVVSSIIADNSAGSGADVALAYFETGAATVDGASNLVGAAGVDVTLPADTLLGASPGLLPLAVNGGPTRTHALVECSPAIDAGSNPSGRAWDQRGDPFVREFNGAADIGAFEWQPNLDLIFGDGFESGSCPP